MVKGSDKRQADHPIDSLFLDNFPAPREAQKSPHMVQVSSSSGVRLARMARASSGPEMRRGPLQVRRLGTIRF